MHDSALASTPNPTPCGPNALPWIKEGGGVRSCGARVWILVHYLDTEKVTRQAVVHEDILWRRGGDGRTESGGTSCHDGRVQRWGSWGDSWWWWSSVPNVSLWKHNSNHGCWDVGLLQLKRKKTWNWNMNRQGSWAVGGQNFVDEWKINTSLVQLTDL